MIRITQSYLLNLTITYLKEKGWEILYTDKPGGRRSGVGIIAAINSIWERLYNLSPDILALKNSNLLLIEVDESLNDNYLNKFKKFNTRSDDVIRGIENILKKPIHNLLFGFVAKKSGLPKEVPDELRPFLFMNYDEQAGIKETNFNVS